MGTHPIFESDFDCLTVVETKMVRALVGRALLGTSSGAGRFTAVVVLGALCLEFGYNPWIENYFFCKINQGISYQTITQTILAQQEAMGGDDDEEEDEDDE